MAMDFFEENKLLPFLASFNQLNVRAAGLVVDPSLGLAHNLKVEARVQYPASCARADGDLHDTKEINSI